MGAKWGGAKWSKMGTPMSKMGTPIILAHNSWQVSLTLSRLEWSL